MSIGGLAMDPCRFQEKNAEGNTYYTRYNQLCDSVSNQKECYGYISENELTEEEIEIMIEMSR